MEGYNECEFWRREVEAGTLTGKESNTLEHHFRHQKLPGPVLVSYVPCSSPKEIPLSCTNGYF